MTGQHDTAPTARTVLVTGAAGGLGTAVTAHLAATGWTVVGADAQPVPYRAHLAATAQGDLCDPAAVRAAFDTALERTPPDGLLDVVHLAAIPAPGIVDEYETLRINTMSAYTVFQEAGRRTTHRIVGASSAAAIGLAWADRDQAPRYLPIDENHPDLTVDSYGLSKQLSEQAAAFTTRRWGTTTVMLRFPFIGEGPRLEARLAEVADDPAANRRELWAWLHTKDAAEAVRAALTAPLTGHHVVNAAAPDTSAQLPTGDLLLAHYPETAILAGIGRHGSLFDSTRAQRLLDFTPSHGWRTPEPSGPGAPSAPGRRRP
ncbi:NAD-dependent epimerase/dehydratase family protein [Streptomyces sp. NPDC096142]|uniref:NAD-dependent epimerase/dehydratase family protein n=1 Tax=Streptomyces sp. NPDC096142 TaxID=3366077 RepID=UPI003814BDBC